MEMKSELVKYLAFWQKCGNKRKTNENCCFKKYNSKCFSIFWICYFFNCKRNLEKSVDYNVYLQNSIQFRFHLLQVNTGSLTYPKYQINSSGSIFDTREKFIDYTKVSEMEKEFDLHVERKQYHEAYKIYLKIRGKLIGLMEKIILEGDSLVCSFSIFLTM